MTIFDPKVKQGTSDLHDHAGEASLDVVEGVLKYPTTLDASNGMFDNVLERSADLMDDATLHLNSS